LAEGDTAESLANRAEEWNTIKAAVEHGTAIPIDASQNLLLGYHYTLQKQSRQLEKERSEIRRRRDSAIEASAATRHIRTAEGTAGTDQELKTSSTEIGETSLETLTHPSYRPMSKATLYQRHPKQHWWQQKHIYTPRGQAQGIQESICIEKHYKD
jgi:hypothetical protein